jgi:sugar phosphate isomerase/epimerase
MRIGNQTAQAAEDPFTPYHFALHHGFDAFEWFADRQHERGFDFSLIGSTGREALRHRGHEAGMRFTVHAAWRSDPLAEDGAEPLHEAIDFAGAIDASLVVFHLAPGVDPVSWIEAMAPIISHADGAGVRLALENTPATPPAAFNELFAWLGREHLAPQRVGMCFDMGHANLVPDTRHDFLAYFDQLSEAVPIIHAHLHENFGDFDHHLPVGRGPAGDDPAGLRGLLRRLQQRGETECLIMEQWPDPPELLCQARDLLQAQLNEAMLKSV